MLRASCGATLAFLSRSGPATPQAVRTVAPDTLVAEALELMGRADLNQLPVVRYGQLAGVISRGHILRLLQTRAELQV